MSFKANYRSVPFLVRIWHPYRLTTGHKLPKGYVS